MADDGPGLSEQMQRDLFQPFVGGSSGGAGLGLVICQDMARACGGQLQVRNRVHAGTVQGLDASLWLPAPAAASGQLRDNPAP